MAVGTQTSKGAVDQSLTDLAVTLRNLAQKAANMETMLNAAASGDVIAALAAIGYSTTPDPTKPNPGGLSDAAYAAQFLGYMSTMSGIYYGQVQQGGTDGTGATLFDFNTALAPLWGGQLG